MIQVPYFWAGIKAYDLVSGANCLKSSYFIDKGKKISANYLINLL
jgi:glycerol-3-phosphate dehydrogenase